LQQNAFGGRVPPEPTGGAYSASPDPRSWILGVGTGKGGEGKGGAEGKGGGEREGRK